MIVRMRMKGEFEYLCFDSDNDGIKVNSFNSFNRFNLFQSFDKSSVSTIISVNANDNQLFIQIKDHYKSKTNCFL